MTVHAGMMSSTVVYLPSARTTTAGSRSMTVNKTRAARSGTRRPCSQSCTARASRPKRSANIRRLSFKRLRTARIRSAGGSSAIRHGRSISPRTWARTQGHLDLAPDLGSFRRHLSVPSFLIVATSGDSTFCQSVSGRPDRLSHKPSANRWPRGRQGRNSSSGYRPACPGRRLPNAACQCRPFLERPALHRDRRRSLLPFSSRASSEISLRMARS